jgi:hypothetical protein
VAIAWLNAHLTISRFKKVKLLLATIALSAGCLKMNNGCTYYNSIKGIKGVKRMTGFK